MPFQDSWMLAFVCVSISPSLSPISLSLSLPIRPSVLPLSVLLLFSCPSHKVLPHPGTFICPLCDGDEVFVGARLVKLPAAEKVGYCSPQSQLTDCVLSM